jgi:GNAT superfamily N-acetyltransferase
VAALVVRAVEPSEEAAAVDTIVLAFSADPVARWCWPDPHGYLTHMPAFVRAFAGNAFRRGGAYCTDDYVGAALWLPPSVHPDEAALSDLLERTLSSAVRGDLGAVLERLAPCHPRAPHWYLPMIGVDPAHHGKGRGAALLAPALRVCDRDHLPAYLESTNPRNVSLYERHGFHPVARIQVGGSPPFVPMVRPAR